MSKMLKSVVVVGAGISGLLAAGELHRQGVKVTVLDKGRGVGGRMATRRSGNLVFDHGCQFFTARTPEFQRLCRQWVQEGVARQWFDSDRDGGHPRYRGVPSMTAVAKCLARDQAVCRGEKVIWMNYQRGTWILRTEAGQEYDAHYVILAMPVPQALELLENSGIVLPERARASLARIKYDKTITVLAELDGPSGLGAAGILELDEPEPLRLIVDNHLKGVSPDGVAVTLHSGPAYAERRFDDSKNVWIDRLTRTAEPHLKSRIKSATAHRWRFANSLGKQEEDCYFNPKLHLMLAGDGFGGPRVEGAALSGLAAGRKLLEVL